MPSAIALCQQDLKRTKRRAYGLAGIILRTGEGVRVLPPGHFPVKTLNGIAQRTFEMFPKSRVPVKVRDLQVTKSLAVGNGSGNRGVASGIIQAVVESVRIDLANRRCFGRRKRDFGAFRATCGLLEEGLVVRSFVDRVITLFLRHSALPGRFITQVFAMFARVGNELPAFSVGLSQPVNQPGRSFSRRGFDFLIDVADVVRLVHRKATFRFGSRELVSGRGFGDERRNPEESTDGIVE